MVRTAGKVACLALNVFFFTHLVSGLFPRAQNVTWTSTNFKTILTWGPKPSAEYSYTVEYSVIGGDLEQNPHCIRSTETMCDLSSSLTDLRSTYLAEVLSEPPRGISSDLVEFPHTRSERFNPYQDTEIDRPEFKIEESKDKRKVTLYVSDPPTAIFEGNRQLTIRDIFAEDLHYKVTYSRASSTGKKEHISKTSEIEIGKLDYGKSYCFSVQAYIPSRAFAKQLGSLSHIQCSEGDKAFGYSVGAIIGGILLILVVVGTIVGVTVACCKCRRKGANSEKEGVPLRSV